MRQRITFFHEPQSPVDPALLRLADASLTGPTIEAAREDRVTLALDEIPTELARILGSSVHELHVRWARRQATASVSPLLAQLSPGLHVFYTPQSGAEPKHDAICALLRTFFGQSLDCTSLNTSFTASGGDRFSHAAAYQYYAPLDDLSKFADYARAAWCPAGGKEGTTCALPTDHQDDISALDLSYDAISHTLKVTTLWAPGSQKLHVASPQGSRTEVGILAADAPATLQPFELGVAGHVAVLGQDHRASPVMFAFPSRHRKAEGASFSVDFLQPTGLHPTLQLRIASRLDVPHGSSGGSNSASSCKLHAYLTLPRHIFADKYQLSDPLFLASKNLTALHHITQPVDLEAPDYAVGVWGSAALLELAQPTREEEKGAGGGVWTAEVPLHLRYLHPAAGGYRNAEVPYPVVFWACAAEEGTKFSTNPFDRVNLGYDGLFGPRTEFWHVDPDPRLSGSSDDLLVSSVRVPVLDSAKAQWVNAGTATAIFVGFFWILWKLLGVYRKAGYGRAPAAVSEKKTQ